MKTFYHRGSFGDIIYSLPTIRHHGRSNLILKNKSHYNFFYNLLNIQDYINELKHLEDGITQWSEININLDQFRKIHKRDLNKPLVQCHAEILDYNNLNFKNPWVFNVKKNFIKPIVINRTLRYHDKEKINWSLLAHIQKHCCFIGTKKEYLHFINNFNFNIEYRETKNALEVAEIIHGADLFIGNQSFCYAVAEALKTDRVLEIFFEKPNCGPLSENGVSSEDMESFLQRKGYI